MHVAVWFRGLFAGARTKVHQIRGVSVDWPLARPLTVPNFIALGQTMYEKSVTNFYTLQYFGAPGGTSCAKFTNLGDDL